MPLTSENLKSVGINVGVNVSADRVTTLFGFVEFGHLDLNSIDLMLLKVFLVDYCTNKTISRGCLSGESGVVGYSLGLPGLTEHTQ